MMLGLAVAFDFHTGAPTEVLKLANRRACHAPSVGALHIDGPPRLGRLDDLPDHNTHSVRGSSESFASNEPKTVTGDDRLIAAKGDLNWWTFEFEREALLIHGTPRQFHPTGSSGAPSSPQTSHSLSTTSTIQC